MKYNMVAHRDDIACILTTCAINHKQMK